MPLLFSYGTLQLPQVQREIFGRSLVGELDVLIGFSQTKVEITDLDVLKSSGERFHPIVTHSGNEKDYVNGMVFDVSVTELHDADAYEVNDYKRVAVKLASGKTAWLYMAQPD